MICGGGGYERPLDHGCRAVHLWCPANAAARVVNLRVLNEAALAVLRRGHVPVMGVNPALPIIEAAGVESFDEIMMALSRALAGRCDAVLRIGGIWWRR